jgi:hypothetical protein
VAAGGAVEVGALIGGGTAASAVLVVTATLAGGGPPGTVPPDGPLGLWRPAADGLGWYGAIVVTAIFGLIVAFALLCRRAAAGRATVADVLRAGAFWCAPVLLAPPLFSLDAYSYLAQGTMALTGLDPYSAGPDQLPDGPILDAVSPVWRATPAPYGPLALALLRLVALLSAGQLPVAVYLLRIVAVAAVCGAALAVARLTRPSERAVALALVVANPLVIVHLVGGAHLDALLALLAGVTVLAVRRGLWAWAAIAAGTAFALKLPGLALAAYVLLCQLRANGIRDHRLWQTAAVNAGTAVACAALVPNGWGWVAALSVPGKIRHPYDPATILGWLLYLPSWAAGHSTGLTSAISAARAVTMVAGAAAVLVLLWRAAGSRSGVRAAALAGSALTVVAVAAPAVHAWYAAWGLALIAAGSTRARWWLAALSAALCFTALPDVIVQQPAGLTLTLCLLAAALAIIHRAAVTPAPASDERRATAGEALP